MIIHNGNDIPILEKAHDPDSTREYAFIMRPDVWQPGTIYYEKESIVIPSMFNGFYYLVFSGGMSGNTEPAFPCRSKATVNDGCVVWKAFPYQFYLRPGKDISTAAWTADNAAVVISTPVTTTGKTIARVSNVPSDASQVKITIHFDFTNGESDDRSFILPVAET